LLEIGSNWVFRGSMRSLYVPLMPADFHIFTPVPLRGRCDGWSPDLQLRFIRLLAEGVKPGEAARRLGRNRQNAYALRRRPGAESFAAAWDAAAEAGRARRARERAAKPHMKGSMHLPANRSAPCPPATAARPAPPPAPPPAPAPAPIVLMSPEEAEKVALRGIAAMDAAAAVSAEEERRAFDAMLEALYGPKATRATTARG
jgi:hypothetical protein